ncbi:MAG: GyrI-like domain-containing protein [Clostridia bacterium]|nr:GyrI-like domain-containing protein [Clostridia bacterium]
MKVTMATKSAFKAVGYSLKPRVGHVEGPEKSGAYWLNSDFSSVSREEYAKIAGDQADEIGMWYHPSEKDGELTYFFGTVVDSFGYIPKGMIKVEIPEADYAVFTTEAAYLKNNKTAFARAIRNGWKYIFEEWFENSGNAYDQTKFSFEYYTDRNGGMDSESAVAEIYIPIKRTRINSTLKRRNAVRSVSPFNVRPHRIFR